MAAAIDARMFHESTQSDKVRDASVATQYFSKSASLRRLLLSCLLLTSGPVQPLGPAQRRTEEVLPYSDQQAQGEAWRQSICMLLTVLEMH